VGNNICFEVVSFEKSLLDKGKTKGQLSVNKGEAFPPPTEGETPKPVYKRKKKGPLPEPDKKRI